MQINVMCKHSNLIWNLRTCISKIIIRVGRLRCTEPYNSNFMSNVGSGVCSHMFSLPNFNRFQFLCVKPAELDMTVQVTISITMNISHFISSIPSFQTIMLNVSRLFQNLTDVKFAIYNGDHLDNIISVSVKVLFSKPNNVSFFLLSTI